MSTQTGCLAHVERGGSVRNFHVPNGSAVNLRPIIATHVHTDSRYATDSGAVSAVLSPPFRSHGRHQTVNRSQHEFVRGDVYTNTVEEYFFILKRGIYGIYQHVSEVHLRRSLSKFDFRYPDRIALGTDDIEHMELAIMGAWGRWLTYYETTRRNRTLIP